MPLWVGTRYLVFLSPFRSRKPMRTSFSIMPARVAGVPRPFRSASSGVSSAPARSMTARSELSVKRFFAVVLPSFSCGSPACTVLPSDRSSGSAARSSWMVRLLLPLSAASAFAALASSSISRQILLPRIHSSISFQPALVRTRDFAAKVCPLQVTVRSYSVFSAGSPSAARSLAAISDSTFCSPAGSSAKSAVPTLAVGIMAW